jgi:hypothetical protein
MWPDNETEIDLLGFDYLVDALEVVLTDESLYPITVGVLGEWGSGKTSLMSMAGSHLTQSPEYLCIGFSPWRFESYDDVKTALMATVLGALTRRIEDDAAAAAEAGTLDPERLKQLRERLDRLWDRVRGFSGAVGPLAALGALLAGLPPQAGAAAAGLIQAAAKRAASESGAEQEAPPAGEALPDYTSAAEFRADFRELVREIDGLKAVIVLVDDVDRCLPPTIIETFEAIRLFLHVPKTAYVIAAHPEIVEAAVAYRYEGNREGDVNIGRDYLEKIIQLPIAVPALSEPEVETYINLLFAQRNLGAESAEFAKVREAAQKVREANQLAVAMNYGRAKDALGEEPDGELQNQFALAASIGPTLAQGLQGNPRQIKRFLNALTLRLRTAEKRGAKLELAILAKLMVLEYLHQAEFQRLFEWQLAQDGRPVELADAEAIVRDGAKPDTVGVGGSEWAAQTAIQAWAAVDPRLAEVPLGPYFFFSREGLSPAAPAARLTGEQQDLLARLHNQSGAVRDGAIEEAVGLDAIARNPVFDALLQSTVRDPQTPALRSSYELASKVRELVPRFAEALGKIPPRKVPGPLPLQMKTAFNTLPAELEAVVTGWAETGSAAVKTSSQRALKKNAGS